MNREEIIDILTRNAEEIVKPYFDGREEIIREVKQRETQKSIRLEQITLEKNSLRVRLDRLRTNKEEEIESYIRDINPTSRNIRDRLEKEYEAREHEYERQFELLEEEEQRLLNVNYSSLKYEKGLPGKKELALAQLGRLIEEIKNQIERKEIELKIVDIDIQSIRNKFYSWQMEERLHNKELVPYYIKQEEIKKQIKQLKELLEKVKEQQSIMFNDEELNNYLNAITKINDEIDPEEPEMDPEEPEIDPEEPEIDPEKPEIDPEEPEIDPEEPEIDPEEPEIDPNKECGTLDEIIFKVCGTEEFTDKQSSKYAASKIKIFSKPEKNKLGLAYKIVSIPKTIIGIIPRATMKLYGQFISKDTKKIFEKMEERANKLTDKEVEILLDQYKGAVAQSKRLPKGFNNAVRDRVNKYVSIRVAKINEQIKDNLVKINYCEKVISCLKEKLNSETTPEMKQRINEVLDITYGKASENIKGLISLQIEGNNLQNGTGLHSFEEELKALDTKLNYVGGRFSKSRTYNPELWRQISGYSQKIEYSLDPKEVVDSYIKRERVYKEKTKEKRSIFNLGSKVTAGELDYRPFVESLNYGNDPFIRDLITSILVISSTASLINNIANNIKQNAHIDEINRQITEHNKSLSDNQEFVQTVRDNGETIEKGIISDIKQTEGAAENLAERGVNDRFDWHLSGKSYIKHDNAHHLETANLSVDNANEILDLSSKYSNGTITYAEYLKGIQSIKEQTTDVYQSYVENLHTYIENYASTHNQFDYTAVLSALKHALANPNESVNLTDFITDLYEKSLNVTDLQSLDLIEKTVTSANLTPDILTLGAVTAKVSQEYVDSKKEIKPDPRKVQEIRDMIEGLKSMKEELTEEEIKEIETFLK